MTDICKGCTKPIQAGEARYTGKEPDECWHFDCHDQRRKAVQPKINDVVIQMETRGLGNDSWVDLSVVASGYVNGLRIDAIIEARDVVRSMTATKKRKFRVIKVVHV